MLGPHFGYKRIVARLLHRPLQPSRSSCARPDNKQWVIGNVLRQDMAEVEGAEAEDLQGVAAVAVEVRQALAHRPDWSGVVGGVGPSHQP